MQDLEPFRERRLRQGLGESISLLIGGAHEDDFDLVVVDKVPDVMNGVGEVLRLGRDPDVLGNRDRGLVVDAEDNLALDGAHRIKRNRYAHRLQLRYNVMPREAVGRVSRS